MDYTELNIILEPKDPWSEILVAQLSEIGFDSFVETPVSTPIFLSMYANTFASSDGLTIPRASAFEPVIDITDSDRPFEILDGENIDVEELDLELDHPSEGGYWDN